MSNTGRRRTERVSYTFSVRHVALIIFNSLMIGGIAGYLIAFLQWWNR